MQEEGRRYRIVGLVGTGGFGRVYRARLESEGFSKEVAIKVLADAEPPADILRRFRDEAKMLGLVRDRAIVAAEPPVRLGGLWAVVMEFVDGCTLGRLIHTHGAVPPSVALEIVEEVARALDKVFHHPGPDGRPLELLHRDIKPGNIQITAHGEVKILDFGIARAQLDDREAETRGVLVGTFDYMAPERIDGIEVPAGDVYSLGRVLEEMLTGRRRTRKEPRIDPASASEPALRTALQLASEMTRSDPEQRPSARDVEHRCEVLLSAIGRKPSLRSWAERCVPGAAQGLTEDGLAGEVLSEITTSKAPRSLDASPPPLPPPARRRVPTWAWLGIIGALVSVVAVFGLIAGMVTMGFTMAFLRSPGSTDAVATAPDVASDPVPVVEIEAPRTAPVEIPGATPPPDLNVPTSVVQGTTADLILGQGRAAVLELGMAPVAYRVSSEIEVVLAPPYLIVSGVASGRGKLVAELEGGGEREWVYDVSRDPRLDPSGGPGLVEQHERLKLRAGVGAVCTFERAPHAAILMDEARGAVEPMGERGFYLEPRETVVDVAFDIERAAPRVITLEALAPGATADDAPIPEGCVVPPPEAVRIPVGGELTLPVDRSVASLIVSNPDAFEVMMVQSDPKKIRVRALRLGEAAIAVTEASGEDPWIRWVIAE